MKKLLLAFFTISSFCGFSQSNSRLNLGSPGDFISAISSEHSRSASTFKLPLNTGETATIAIENYFDKEGDFSMNGVLQTAPNSVFILKVIALL